MIADTSSIKTIEDVEEYVREGDDNDCTEPSELEIQYEIWDDGGCQDTIEAANLTEAIAEATEWMEDGDYTDGNTHSGEFTLRQDGKVVHSGTFHVREDR